MVEKCIYLRRTVINKGLSETTECLANGTKVECGGFSDSCEYPDLFISDRATPMEKITFTKQEPMPDFSHYDSLWDGKTVKQSELNDQETDMVYVATCMDHVVGQFDMENDIVYSLSPEKYKPQTNESSLPCVEPQRVWKNGIQGEFVLTRKIKLKPLILYPK